MANAVTALTEEQIDAILGSVRERGAYKRVMSEFLASDEAGINVTAMFNGKKSASVYQGFNSAKKDLEAEGVRVINHDDTVYLIKQG